MEKILAEALQRLSVYARRIGCAWEAAGWPAGSTPRRQAAAACAMCGFLLMSMLVGCSADTARPRQTSLTAAVPSSAAHRTAAAPTARAAAPAPPAADAPSPSRADIEITRADIAPPRPLPTSGAPSVSGQLILVSLSQQWLWAYANGQLLFDTPVTTGMPGLQTPTGWFSVRYKEQNITFHSPWPPGSPYYYTPEHISYALYFRDYGFYIHNAPRRKQFGPGTNVPHTDPDGTRETGSHGCVNVPLSAGAWLYAWAHDGAKIDIVAA